MRGRDDGGVGRGGDGDGHRDGVVVSVVMGKSEITAFIFCTNTKAQMHAV